MPSKKTPTTKNAAAKPAVKKSAASKAVKKTAVKKAAVKRAVKTAPAPVADSGLPPSWLTAARAADSKKATNLRVLDLRDITSFADFFLICSASNQRQVQAIANEVETELKKQGERATAVEGYSNAEWILMDYGDLIVHIFSEQARSYYDLDRLWSEGKQVPVQL